jgi:hypothetical protein
MRESVPVTCGMLAACGVDSVTTGASGASTGVGFDARFGVGTTTIALPPTDWKVGFAIGWAAPPPTTGRGGRAVGVVWTTGEGEGDAAAGFGAGPSFEAGGGCEIIVQPSIEPATSAATISSRRLDPRDTR